MGRLSTARLVADLYLVSRRAPLPTDDAAHGCQVGLRWLDTTTATEYVCFGATPGAAVWTTPQSALSGSSGWPTSWSVTLTHAVTATYVVPAGMNLAAISVNAEVAFHDAHVNLVISAGSTPLLGPGDSELDVAGVVFEKMTPLPGPALVTIQLTTTVTGVVTITFTLTTA